MKSKYLFILLIAIAFLHQETLIAQERYKSITSGNVWFDQNNRQVNAHGACIVKEGDKYYLFGEYKSDTANVFTGFSCYSSSDLMNWKFEKIVLPLQKNGLLGPVSLVRSRMRPFRGRGTGSNPVRGTFTFLFLLIVCFKKYKNIIYC